MSTNANALSTRPTEQCFCTLKASPHHPAAQLPNVKDASTRSRNTCTRHWAKSKQTVSSSWLSHVTVFPKSMLFLNLYHQY